MAASFWLFVFYVKLSHEEKNNLTAEEDIYLWMFQNRCFTAVLRVCFVYILIWREKLCLLFLTVSFWMLWLFFFSWKQQLHRFIDCCGGCWSWQVFSVLVIMMIMFVWWKKQTFFSSVIFILIIILSLPSFFNVIFKASMIPAPNSFTMRLIAWLFVDQDQYLSIFKGRWLWFSLLISNWKLKKYGRRRVLS